MVRDELDAVEEGVAGIASACKDLETVSKKVTRDAKGRIAKGSVAINAGGFTRKQLELKKAIDKLSAPAIATLARLLESENAGAALGAAKEILDRTMGKVKQQVNVDVAVEHTHVMHLDALRRLNDKARATSDAITIDHVASE